MSRKRSTEAAFGTHEATTPTKRQRRPRKHGQERSHIISTSKSQSAVKTLSSEAPNQPSAPNAAPLLATVHQKSHRKNKKHKFRQSKARKGWSISAGTGGIFLNQDPILTANEQNLILPTASFIQIYSTATSLLVRSIDVGEDQFITGCCINPSGPNELFVATALGLITKWDWTTGSKIHEWRWRNCPVWILCAIGVKDGHGDQVLILHQNTGGQREVSRFSLGDASGNLAPGRQIDQNTSNATEPTYTWREATVPGLIASMDARFGLEKMKHGVMRTTVDVALGFKNGTILLYEDILYQLTRKEKDVKSADIISRRLHWHRDTVKTVKWSRDGNYVISGGRETVLVIWQLDTNQKQFLPHLSTSILNLTVSTGGSSYALRLADNSVMVLSTADLRPFANISSLALHRSITGRLPAVLQPRNANQLVAAVPRISIPSHHQDEKQNATLLQTFDLDAGVQIGRQALTRNVITVLNAAPTGHQVAEPDVIFLQISNDGQWLITIDEWIPPAADLEPILPSSAESRSRLRLKETCLRFWRWSEDGQHWELVTRVDEPHPKSGVLGLAVNPLSNEAATVGTDGILRLWTPKSRSRSGIAVKDRFGKQLQTWTCSVASQIEPSDAEGRSDEGRSATLAFSEDGSVIAASWSILSNTQRSIHFVDSVSGTTRLSQPDLVRGAKANVGFLGRYLLCLSEDFCIWDPVNSRTTFVLALNDLFKSTSATGFLAVNRLNSTFALGFNSRIAQTAQVAVFDMQKLTEGPLSQIEIRNHIKLLISQTTTLGFVIIDEQNRIRQISPPGTAGLNSVLVLAQREQVANSLNNIFGSGTAVIEATSADTGKEQLALPVIEAHAAARSVDGLFSFSAASKPSWSLGDLFQKVAGLFAKPTTAE